VRLQAQNLTQHVRLGYAGGSLGLRWKPSIGAQFARIEFRSGGRMLTRSRLKAWRVSIRRCLVRNSRIRAC
jgi:hypothetical protein